MPSAIRPVFVPDTDGVLVLEDEINFTWFSGMSVAQYQRSIASLHEVAARKGWGPLLEVSTRSRDSLGVRLSAFNLKFRTSLTEKPVSVEAAFQSSKLFKGHGNMPHLLTMDDGRAIKAQVGQFRDVPLEGFAFEDRSWELTPTTAFYDYLYLRALCDTLTDRPEIADALAGFRGFTDIAYNPKKSFNCQARSCALFIALGGRVAVSEFVAEPDQLISTMFSHNYQVPDQKEQQRGLFDSH
jgi:hypothetical protein